MTAVALKQPHRFQPTLSVVDPGVSDVATLKTRKTASATALLNGSIEHHRRYGLWLALGVSALLHGWVSTWVNAPAAPNASGSSGPVSIAIGSFSLTSPQPAVSDPAVPEIQEAVSEPVEEIESKSTSSIADSFDPSEFADIPADAEHNAIVPTPEIPKPERAEKQRVAEKPVVEPSDNVAAKPRAASKKMHEQKRVTKLSAPPNDHIDKTDSAQSETLVASASAQSVQAIDTQPAALPSLPLLVTNPDYRSPPSPPVYPRRAVRFGQEGTVMVRAHLSEHGDVITAEITQSSGHSLLDKAALKAVQQWLFKPATRDGRAVLAMVDLPVHFKLQ